MTPKNDAAPPAITAGAAPAMQYSLKPLPVAMDGRVKPGQDNCSLSAFRWRSIRF
jgi:hypothetical protein